MKTLRISDEIHRKLTATVGTLMAQTGKMQTYQDAIEAMLTRSVILSTELLAEIEEFIEENKQLGFITREELIRDTARWRLKFLREESEYVEIPRDKYERLEAAVKEMNTPYNSASDFVHTQIDEVLEKYGKWLEEKSKKTRKKTLSFDPSAFFEFKRKTVLSSFGVLHACFSVLWESVKYVEAQSVN